MAAAQRLMLKHNLDAVHPDDVATYRKLGVSELTFDFRTPDLPETLDRMSRFALDVMPLT